MTRSRRRVAVLPLLLLCTFVFLLGRTSEAVDDPDFTLVVRGGMGGFRRPGRWMSIRVEVANAGPAAAGSLTVVVSRPNGTPDRYEQRVDLPRGSRKALFFYVLDAAGTTIRAELDCGARTASAAAPLGPAPVGYAYVVLGATGADSTKLNTFTQSSLLVLRNAQFYAATPQDMPDRELGYDGVDQVFIAQATGACFGSPAQEEAFWAWVHGGGRAVVLASQGAGPLRGTSFESELPAIVGPVIEVRNSLARADALPEGVAADGVALVSSVTDVRGEVVSERAGVPLALVGASGRGRLLLVTIDPTTPVFRNWQEWDRVLEKLWPYARDWSDGPAWHSEVLELLESFRLSVSVRIGWLAILLVAFAMALGPVNLALAARLRPPRRIWLASLGWVVLFGAASYAVGVASTGRALSLRLATVVDVDGRTGGAHMETLASLYSPDGGSVELAADEPGAFLAPLRGESRARAPGFDSAGEQFDQTEGVRPRSVWIPPGGMRSFALSACPRVGGELPIRAVRAGNGLTLRNQTEGPLANLTIVTLNHAWPSLGTLAAGQTRTLPLPEAEGLGSQWSFLRGPDWRRLPARADWASHVSRVEAFLFSEARRRPSPTAWENRLDDLAGRVLPWLRSGGMVVLATTPTAPRSLRVVGQSPEVLEFCLVRVFVAPVGK
ncbi:MAG: hypothetical protein HYZ53_27365 [Planctomycetes bacterium]|nr:hypothetical protein [Planctomycetota bacterium]